MEQFAQGTKKEWSTFYLSDTSFERSVFNKSFSVTRKPYAPSSSRIFFRFSFLLIDLITINLINFLLVLIFQRGNTTPEYTLLFFVSNLAWIVSAYVTAVYFAYDGFFKRSVQAFLLFLAFTLLFIFAYHYSYSRLFVMISFAGFGGALTVSRGILLGTQHYLTKRVSASNIIFLGRNELSQHLVKRLSLHRNQFNIMGFFDDEPQEKLDERYPVLGRIEQCINYALEHGISEIYSTIPPETKPEIYEIAQQAEKNFIRFKFVPDFRLFINRKVHIGFEFDIPVLSLHSEPLQTLENRLKKRIFDVLFSSFVIVFILSWLVPIIALLIKLESRGPVFFKQMRSGKDNKPFYCFKFRSLKMNKDADVKQVTKHDNRMTRIGRFLRKTNLDELPQFYNVLQGYMSVVGPRPHMLKHTQEYSSMMNHYMVRHFVKPGVTGWAQINGYRGEITKAEQLHRRVEYDIAYLENWSMWFDLKIILLTVYTTIRGDKNAY